MATKPSVSEESLGNFQRRLYRPKQIFLKRPQEISSRVCSKQNYLFLIRAWKFSGMFVVTKPMYFSPELEPSTAVLEVIEPSVFKDISKHVFSNQKGEDAS